MALINCPECSKEVSDMALACPHCGFGVAGYIEKERIAQQELADEQKRQEKKQQELERRQELARTIKSKMDSAAESARSKADSVAEKVKNAKSAPKQLHQCGKKSFWILVPLLPYVVIAAALPYIRDYFVRKQIGMLPEGDTFISWFSRNVWPMLPMLTVAVLTLLVLPCIFYIVANQVKNTKCAKKLLILGTVYYALLFALTVVSAVVNYFDITILLRFLIPLCAYGALFYKAVHGKK